LTRGGLRCVLPASAPGSPRGLGSFPKFRAPPHRLWNAIITLTSFISSYPCLRAPLSLTSNPNPPQVQARGRPPPSSRVVGTVLLPFGTGTGTSPQRTNSPAAYPPKIQLVHTPMTSKLFFLRGTPPSVRLFPFKASRRSSGLLFGTSLPWTLLVCSTLDDDKVRFYKMVAELSNFFSFKKPARPVGTARR